MTGLGVGEPPERLGGGAVDGPSPSEKVGTFIEQRSFREKMQIFEKPLKGGLIQSNQLDRKTQKVRGGGGNRKERAAGWNPGWVEPRWRLSCRAERQGTGPASQRSPELVVGGWEKRSGAGS